MKSILSHGPAVNAGTGGRRRPNQRGRAEPGTECALRDDPGGDVQPALAHRVPARWPHGDHREGRTGLAGHPAGRKDADRNVPAVLHQGQGGMFGVYVSPHYATDQSVYLTYSEPGRGVDRAWRWRGRGWRSGAGTASLEGLQVLWREMPKGRGGQFGAAIAFSPDGQLSVPDGRRSSAHDARPGSRSPLGKILRLTLDGKPAPGNPMAGKTGAASVPLINPPRDTELAKTAPVISDRTRSRDRI